MKKVLYATDYSEASQYALQVAESLARDGDARLLIVHVSETEASPVGELFDEDPEPSPAEVARLNAVVPRDTRVSFEHRLICPAPASKNVHIADEIVQLAEQEDVDAIVIGTHGRTGLSRLLAGEVAEYVMRRATCAVVAVGKRHA
jgi:nucleotide-binding universal stress UspA family protein